MVKTLNAPQIATSDKMVVIPRNKTPILFFKKMKPWKVPQSNFLNLEGVFLSNGASDIKIPEIM